jgi:uncharacterized protein YndB with AHSA1/START domain
MSSENYAYENAVVVRAAPAAVYAALTSADQLQRWFMSRAETDPRPGGAFHFAWNFADAAQNGTQAGKFVEAEPGRVVSYTWQARPSPAPLTLVTFTLSPEGDGTRVRLAHTGFGEGPAGQAALNQHAGPWDFYLANLRAYLEDGVDNRSAVLKQETAA